MIGQCNVSPGNVPEVECYWGQDEHPLLKGAHEEETETGPGLSAMVMEPGYEMLNKDTLPEVVAMLSEEEKDKGVVPVRVERYHY